MGDRRCGGRSGVEVELLLTPPARSFVCAGGETRTPAASSARRASLYHHHLSTSSPVPAMVATSDLPPHVLDKIRPSLSFSSSPLLLEQHAKHDLALKLDADRQICRLNLAPEGCPLGAALCPLRHTEPAEANFKGPKLMPSHPRERERLNTVCKHWLRGLCKKVRRVASSFSCACDRSG